MYVSECMDARVTAFQDGQTWVVADGLPGVNGIDVFEGRLFVDQFLPEGKLWELSLDGSIRVLLADGLAGPNGMCAAPDGHVYFVQVFTGEVRRVPMDGGAVETVADGLAAPSSVRLGPDGLIYVSEGGSGEVATIDPSTRAVTTIARARPGIDNLAVDDDGRVFISYYVDGAVYEVIGETDLRELVPPGLLGPYGVAVTPTGVHVADGLAASRLQDNGEPQAASKFTDAGFPGYLRGLGATRGGPLLATTSEGRVARFDPNAVTSELLVDGLAEPMGVAESAGGAAIVAEAGKGRVVEVHTDGTITVVADGFARPTGVASAGEAIFVADEHRGTVERLDADGRATLLDGLSHPHDLCVSDDRLFVVEAGAGRIVVVPLAGGEPEVVATGLPVGTGGGVRGTLNGLPEMIPGPISPFAGLDVGDGALYIGGDADGVVVVLEPVGGAL
jgi:sugar lactone lactonase YvrE